MMTNTARQKIAQDAEVDRVIEVDGCLFAVVDLSDAREVEAITTGLTAAVDAYYQRAE